jgi:hypothetical protein
MNIFDKHYQNLAQAKNLVGQCVTGQRPNTYNAENKINGIAVSVRECITGYDSLKPARILVDINHNGTITPCDLDSVEPLNPPNEKGQR